MTRLTDAELTAALTTHEYEIISDSTNRAIEVTQDSVASWTMDAKPNNVLAAIEDEKAASKRFWKWVTEHEVQYPQLRWLTHHESGGYRPIVVAARLKTEGQRAGFPDYALYWSNTLGEDIFVGWAMELKRANRTNHPSDLQAQWLAHLAWEGWKCVVCYGADEAIAALMDYLGAVK